MARKPRNLSQKNVTILRDIKSHDVTSDYPCPTLDPGEPKNRIFEADFEGPRGRTSGGVAQVLITRIMTARKPDYKTKLSCEMSHKTTQPPLLMRHMARSATVGEPAWP